MHIAMITFIAIAGSKRLLLKRMKLAEVIMGSSRVCMILVTNDDDDQRPAYFTREVAVSGNLCT